MVADDESDAERLAEIFPDTPTPGGWSPSG
jgi:hypothetical protein